MSRYASGHVAIFEKDGNRFFFPYHDQLAPTAEEAWQIGVGSFIECLMYGFKFTGETIEVIGGKIPNSMATLANFSISVISGPIFEEGFKFAFDQVKAMPAGVIERAAQIGIVDEETLHARCRASTALMLAPGWLLVYGFDDDGRDYARITQKGAERGVDYEAAIEIRRQINAKGE